LLLDRIQSNHDISVVLKLREHLSVPVVTEVLLSAVVSALSVNTVCQAVYMFRYAAMTDAVMDQLISVLLSKPLIWCVNVGESTSVSTLMWEKFANALCKTSVTHLYISEGHISSKLKNTMLAVLAENRNKHTLYCADSNCSIVRRCKNLWNST
jgi:hypothetical protein